MSFVLKSTTLTVDWDRDSVDCVGDLNGVFLPGDRDTSYHWTDNSHLLNTTYQQTQVSYLLTNYR